MQGWLISTQTDVDEQDRPQPEAEEANANVEKASVEPSTTLLEKLAVKMDKLEADMAEIKFNQQYIIELLTHP